MIIHTDLNRELQLTTLLLNSIASKTAFTEGGSKFYDKSALYHIHAERRFSLDTNQFFKLDITTGGNYRMYTPMSQGTLFSDSTERITNQEGGLYLGLEKRFLEEKLKVNGTFRADKNQNFDMVFSPAASMVYKFDINNILAILFFFSNKKSYTARSIFILQYG